MNDETDFSRPEKRPKNTTNNPHQGAVLCGPENWREYRKEGEKGEREEIRKQASGKRKLTQNREEERQRRANTQLGAKVYPCHVHEDALRSITQPPPKPWFPHPWGLKSR